jgi:hypothetical protein
LKRLGLSLRKKSVKCYSCNTALDAETWTLYEVEQKLLENKLVLEKGGDQLDRSCYAELKRRETCYKKQKVEV